MTALYFKQIAVLPPPIPLTAEIANEVHIHGKVQVSDLPPAVLVEISKTPEYLKNLRPVKYIMTGGGPLPNGPGDIINSHTRLFAGFGSTETGHIQAALPPKENVSIPHPNLFSGIFWAPPVFFGGGGGGVSCVAADSVMN